MSDNAAEFAKIKMLHGGAVLHQEGGKPVVLLPKLSFLSGGQSHTMDVLLYPSSHSGYDFAAVLRAQNGERESRLDQLPGAGARLVGGVRGRTSNRRCPGPRCSASI